MLTRKHRNPSDFDFLRYLEGLQHAINLKFLFKGTLSNHDGQAVLKQLLGDITVQLSMALHELLLTCFLAPF